jgi:hypothetical protein
MFADPVGQVVAPDLVARDLGQLQLPAALAGNRHRGAAALIQHEVADVGETAPEPFG